MNYEEIYKEIENSVESTALASIVVGDNLLYSCFYIFYLQIYFLVRVIFGIDINGSIFSRDHPDKLSSVGIFGTLGISLWVQSFMESSHEIL